MNMRSIRLLGLRTGLLIALGWFVFAPVPVVADNCASNADNCELCCNAYSAYCKEAGGKLTGDCHFEEGYCATQSCMQLLD
jgi:hypothetical protein